MMTHERVILERALEDAKELLETQRAAIEDLNVQCKFWRQAAEHAVDGWNKLEDEHELLLETLRALSANDDAPPELSCVP